MKECTIYSDKMWQDYLLNKLSREELENAQFHLCHCEVCRERLQRMRSFMAEDTRQVYMDIVVRKSQKSVFPVFKVVASVVLLLSVSIGAWLLVRPSSQGEIPATITPSPEYNTLDSLDVSGDSIDISVKKDTFLLSQLLFFCQ